MEEFNGRDHEDLDEILSAYDPNRELDITWLNCDPEVLRERIHERIAINGKTFTVREIEYGIHAITDAFGKRIVGHEAYDEEFAHNNPYQRYIDGHDVTQEIYQMYKDFAKVLREELDVYYTNTISGFQPIIIGLHSIIENLQYKPYGDKEHSNDETDHVFQKIYHRQELSPTEKELMLESIHNTPSFDYRTWWDEFTG